MTFMERTCFRFVPLPRNSFVFIIEIGYILFYLRLRGDKCLRCAPFRRYLLSSTATSSMRHLLSAFLGTRKILLSRALKVFGFTSTCIQLLVRRRTFSRAFHSRTHVTTFPIGWRPSSRSPDRICHE